MAKTHAACLGQVLAIGLIITAALAASGPAQALDRIRLHVAGGNKDLTQQIQDASLVVTAKREGRTDPSDVFAAALSDYARILDTLYASGYYGGVVHILVDGREAADLPLLRAPERIGEVAISVAPGPPFRFADARVGPLPPRAEMPEGFRRGLPARAPVVREAVQAAVDEWRAAGYPKVAPAGERISADHKTATLDAVVALAPGRVARFGDLVIETPSAVRAAAIRRIAGLPKGERFSPEAAKRVAERLRETGAFASVSLTEAEQIGPDGELDFLLSVADRKPRRFGFGAEISSLAGLELSGYWMHRNIFGGAERLRFDARVSNIAGSDSGTDYFLGARLETPAPFGPETKAFTYVNLDHKDEPGFISDKVELGFGVGKRFSERIEAEIALAYLYSETKDDLGDRSFSLLTFPASGTYDSRDVPLDATEGYFLNLQVTPFIGLNGTGTGARSYADARAYYGFGTDDRVVLAGRLQFGSIAGADITDVHPDFLFYSGGAGTVRGHPYKSLDVDLGGGNSIGGRSFVGASAELRTRFTDTIGAVLFADAGYVGGESFYDGSGEWQTGAGIGLRYLTGIGPVRLDVAAPVSGGTGDGVQIYVGIGQAF